MSAASDSSAQSTNAMPTAPDDASPSPFKTVFGRRLTWGELRLALLGPGPTDAQLQEYYKRLAAVNAQHGGAGALWGTASPKPYMAQFNPGPDSQAAVWGRSADDYSKQAPLPSFDILQFINGAGDPQE